MRPRPEFTTPPTPRNLEAYENALREWEEERYAEEQLVVELSKRVATAEDFLPEIGTLAERLRKLEDQEPFPGPQGLSGPRGADGYGPIAVTRITDLTYTVIDSDREIFVNTDTNAVTVTLQPGTQGRRMRLVNTGTSRRNLTITPDGAERLIGENSSFTLRDGETLVLVYDATDGWY